MMRINGSRYVLRPTCRHRLGTVVGRDLIVGFLSDVKFEEDPPGMENPAEVAENAAMQRASEDGPAALQFLRRTAVVKDAYVSGVAPGDVDQFVWKITAELGREGLLRAQSSGESV